MDRTDWVILVVLLLLVGGLVFFLNLDRFPKGTSVMGLKGLGGSSSGGGSGGFSSYVEAHPDAGLDAGEVAREALGDTDPLVTMNSGHFVNFTCIDEHTTELDDVYYGCMDLCEADLMRCYDTCDDTFPAEEAELSSEVFHFFEIIPVAAAITGPATLYDCYDGCDYAYYDEENYTHCERGCETEVVNAEIEMGCILYVNETSAWDGTPVTDIGAFYRGRFPISVLRLYYKCTGFFAAGDWVETPEKIGCLDFDFFDFMGEDTCGDDEGIVSAKNVCDTIGKVWSCTALDISCSER